jgi:hypothetical protein
MIKGTGKDKKGINTIISSNRTPWNSKTQTKLKANLKNKSKFNHPSIRNKSRG